VPTAKEAVSRMNALSVGRRQEVLEAVRISVCHRQALHLNVAFTDVISKCNKYQTMPDVVSNLFCSVFIIVVQCQKVNVSKL
jgi:hypothetical protein